MTQAKDQLETRKRTPRQHHRKAAEVHEETSKHHGEAARDYPNNDNNEATRRVLIADGPAPLSTFTAREQ